MTETPSAVPSEEVDDRQLDLARTEGDAYHESLEYMATQVAHSGEVKRAGEYFVGYAQEEAEGLYVPGEDGALEWTEPEDENCHLEVSVSDATDRRFVPHLTVHATLESGSGETVGPVEVPFLWHPGLYHYGTNLRVPGDGTYTLTVRIEPPSFGRHDRKNGDRYAEPVEVRFEDVDVKTGQS